MARALTLYAERRGFDLQSRMKDFLCIDLIWLFIAYFPFVVQCEVIFKSGQAPLVQCATHAMHLSSAKSQKCGIQQRAEPDLLPYQWGQAVDLHLQVCFSPFTAVNSVQFSVENKCVSRVVVVPSDSDFVFQLPNWQNSSFLSGGLFYVCLISILTNAVVCKDKE